MAKKKVPNEKLSIDAYKAMITQKKSRRFRIEFYPWPVQLALTIPFAFFFFIIIMYIFHIKNLAD